VISLACDRLWSHSRVNDLIAIRSWSRQALATTNITRTLNSPHQGGNRSNISPSAVVPGNY